MKTQIIVIPILIIISWAIFLTIFTGWPLVYWYNDLLLNNYLNDLKSISYSVDTKIIDQSKRLGILWGNGNHCAMEVMILIESNLEPTQVYKIMNARQLKSPFRRKSMINIFDCKDNRLYLVRKNKTYEVDSNKVGYYVKERLDKYLFLFLDYSQFEVIKKLIGNHKFKKTKNYYIIAASDQEDDGICMLDLRCH